MTCGCKQRREKLTKFVKSFSRENRIKSKTQVKVSTPDLVPE